MTSVLLDRGMELALRTVLAPGFLAARWLTPRPHLDADVPVAPASLSLALKIALDEIFLLTEVFSASFVGATARERLRAEAAAALAFYRARGWLDDPAGYHPPPPPLESPRGEQARSCGLSFIHLRFESGYAPHDGEPGRERWLAHVANRTAHAWVLEHPGPPRPWLVCVPGYRMGHPLVDFFGFPVPWLHRRLGVNVLIPVLPLHGPRTVGRRSGDGFLTGDYLDTVHVQAQAIWDVRRLIGWLFATRAPAVGVYGVSLGGYTAALLAGIDERLACVIAGIPAICYVGVARWNVPPILLRLAEYIGLAWDDIERLLRVVSPLALMPRVPRERRFLFAGMADRLVPPQGVCTLWRHWERPRLAWYEGTHVSFGLEPAVRALLREALETSGLLAS